MDALIQAIFSKYGKAQLTPKETAEVSNRSEAMLAKDRMSGVGIDYVKVGKGKSAKVYYPITSIIEFMQSHAIKTA